MKKYYSLNYSIFEGEEILLKINDRAFSYGDGFFETLTCINGHIPFWSLHLERIENAFTIFGFNKKNLDGQKILEEVKHLYNRVEITNSVVKISFWRKEGGLFKPESHDFNMLIQVKSAGKSKDEIRVAFSGQIKNYYSLYSEIKTLSAAHYVLCGLEIKHSGLDDLIICDGESHVSELSSSNIFWIEDEQLYTPPLSTGCVNGTVRKAILKHYNTTEKLISKDELISKDAVFSTNVSSLKAIIQIEVTPLKTTQNVLFSELKNWFKQQRHL